MLVGDPQRFAIESELSVAYERASFLGLGSFALHVGGLRYGVAEPEATLLACSFDEAARRRDDRGRHTAPFAGHRDAAALALAFRSAFYHRDPPDALLGTPLAAFRRPFERKVGRCVWAPDGDEAFDDGSYVLQFDLGDTVRLLAFRPGDGETLALDTVRDMRLPAPEFYGLLERWVRTFEAEWRAKPKRPS